MEIQTNTQGSLAVRVENLLRARPVVLQLLKFAAIGVINTALDFLLLNLISKYLNISSGTGLGLVNLITFSIATIQSYFWNKAWAFGDSEVGIFKNFIRLFLIGFLGALGVLLAVVGASLSATPIFYLLLLVAFVIAELVLWHLFSLGKNFDQAAPSRQFITFFIVSLIGLLINSGVVSVASTALQPYAAQLGNADVVKNVAKIGATAVSLIWNFIGYKIVVFKK